MKNITLTPAGFQLTKTGRLKAPPFKDINIYPNIDPMKNFAGHPIAQLGDVVARWGSGVSAGTVGKVTSVPKDSGHALGFGFTVELLDGNTDMWWAVNSYVLTPAQLQEVKDFYINDGRASRIKVAW